MDLERGVRGFGVLATMKCLGILEERGRSKARAPRSGGARRPFSAPTHDLDGEHMTDHGALKAAGAVAVTDDGLPVMRDDVMEASLRPVPSTICSSCSTPRTSR